MPHYVAAVPNPKAALALLRRLEGLVGVAVEASGLEEEAESYESQVSRAVSANPEIEELVQRLEQEQSERLDILEDDVPSGEALARDFERYLRQQGNDEVAAVAIWRDQALDQAPQLRPQLRRGLSRVLFPGQDPLAEPIQGGDHQAGVGGGIGAAQRLHGSRDRALLGVAPALCGGAELGSPPRLEPELVLGDVGDSVLGSRDQLRDQPVRQPLQIIERSSSPSLP